jgi:hypothetical protein
MTSEKRLALSHTGFWNALLPMEEPYIRTQNTRVRTFAYEVFSVLPAAQRGVVNECAFLIFVVSVRAGIDPVNLSKEQLVGCADDAFGRVSRLSAFARVLPQPLTEKALHEAQMLATRLTSYFSSRPERLFTAMPVFPGCGWLDEAEGDVLGDRTLFEIKAGERQFRGIDIRQVLCYCALGFSAKVYDIDNFCLVNPRFGTYFEDTLENLCWRTAGMSAAAVLGEIVNYVSEPLSRYSAG